MRLFARLAVVAALISVSACAHGTPPEASPVVADYAPLAGQPTGPHARLYADCIAQAAGSGAYRQVIDGGEELLLFTCTGPLAQRFYEALGSHSAAMDTGFTQDGRSARSTAKVQKNLIGVDYCSVDASGGDPRCVLTFNAGDFLIAD